MSSKHGDERKGCLFGLSGCVVCLSGQGCWRQMGGRKRTLSSVFDLLSLKSLLGAYLEMLVWSLVVGALGLEQGGGKEGRTGGREDGRTGVQEEDSKRSRAGRRLWEGCLSPIASFSRRIRTAGGRVSVHCKLCEFLIKNLGIHVN